MSNQAVRICQNKNNSITFLIFYYKELKALPNRILNKQFTILSVSKKNNFFHIDKREIRAYDVHVNYTKTNFGKHFLDCLDPTYFNAVLMFKKKKTFSVI